MFSHSIDAPAGDSHYAVHAEIVSDAVAEGRVSTVVNVRWRSEATGGEERSVDFHVETDDGNETLRLVHDNEVFGAVSLDTRIPGEGSDPSVVDEPLGPILDGATRLADALVALDPVAGCLIKGAATSVAGQTIRCWQASDPNDSFRDRARSAAACLRSNGMKVAWNFVKRVGKCLISLGLD
ncbi:hypothetical protein [Allosediminivita pacifica]|uniref:Uncharacterized protein n=1 Tax=Allosediminivita pacifica TaxID=1267769 RepID=A0A2T6ATT2_9RHOB|nr:hypothetical protein [Allosediminivita pacifica]PTX47224.1 hypothetical protein C8N44_113110 [Allosediminivita pacifica]GGB09298.1 hypothetical protein GCM10011324_19150 [Allosediminivita pacifica]